MPGPSWRPPRRRQEALPKSTRGKVSPAALRGPVMRKDISFDSRGKKLVGSLFLPDGQPPDARLPTVVVIGPVSSTRKQAPSIYSERFARLGYAALAFDHTSYGDSEGTPRSDEDPFVKSEDIKNAVSF